MTTSSTLQQPDATVEPLGSSGKPWLVLRWCMALLLTASVALKAHALFTVPPFGWGNALLIAAEWALAAWCFVGLGPRVLRRVLMCVFSVFALYNLYLVQRGEASCGCFGVVVRLDPGITLLIDVLILVGLGLCKPRSGSFMGGTSMRQLVITVVLVVLGWGVLGAVAIAQEDPVRLADGGEIPEGEGSGGGGGKRVLLEPEGWVGKPLPITKHVRIDKDLTRGSWMLVLYHHDCQACIRTLRGISAATPERFDAGSVALIQVPPLGPPDHLLSVTQHPYARGELTEERDWLVSTPTVVHLRDGVVVRVDGPQSPPSGKALPVLSEKPGQRLAAEAAEAPICDADEYNFGYVEPGGVRTVRFVIRNPTDQPMKFEAIRSECICLAPTLTEATISPRGQLELPVRFAAPEEVADYAKRIFITTDNPAHKTIVLTGRAAIGRPLLVEPTRLRLDVPPDVPPDLPPDPSPSPSPEASSVSSRNEIRLTNRGEIPVRLISSTSDAPGVVMPIPRVTLARGESATIKIEVAPDRLPKGRTSAVVRVTTDAPTQRSIQIHVEW